MATRPTTPTKMQYAIIEHTNKRNSYTGYTDLVYNIIGYVSDFEQAKSIAKQKCVANTLPNDVLLPHGYIEHNLKNYLLFTKIILHNKQNMYLYQLGKFDTLNYWREYFETVEPNIKKQIKNNSTYEDMVRYFKIEQIAHKMYNDLNVHADTLFYNIEQDTFSEINDEAAYTFYYTTKINYYDRKIDKDYFIHCTPEFQNRLNTLVKWIVENTHLLYEDNATIPFLPGGLSCLINNDTIYIVEPIHELS